MILSQPRALFILTSTWITQAIPIGCIWCYFLVREPDECLCDHCRRIHVFDCTTLIVFLFLLNLPFHFAQIV